MPKCPAPAHEDRRQVEPEDLDMPESVAPTLRDHQVMKESKPGATDGSTPTAPTDAGIER